MEEKNLSFNRGTYDRARDGSRPRNIAAIKKPIFRFFDCSPWLLRGVHAHKVIDFRSISKVSSLKCVWLKLQLHRPKINSQLSTGQIGIYEPHVDLIFIKIQITLWSLKNRSSLSDIIFSVGGQTDWLPQNWITIVHISRFSRKQLDIALLSDLRYISDNETSYLDSILYCTLTHTHLLQQWPCF